ncbi:MAG: glycosyltransferase [Ilumatobacter sp.]|uniref:glycosyltransferase n=1 Tax=Ilumatobacter sp. TaxID=1967498 RepID=UPI0026243B19|nr:glycosyltransferase [Ilumatobacter sp.]MDJ0769197.1 glycosyltransferase [Ilumatobacter sp.]
MSLDIGVFGIRDVPSTYSGYETFLGELLPRLVDRGHRVTVYVRGEPGEREPYRGIRRVRTAAIRSKQLDTLSHSWTAGFAAARARHDVSLVCNVANSLALAALRPFGLRSVLNVDGQEWRRGKWSAAGRAYFRGSAHLARFASRALVTDCRAMADVYRDEFRAASVVIPYPVPESAAPEPDELAPILERWDVVPDGFLFTGGRLVPENNIERIAERYVATEHPYPLLVAGTANYDSPVVRRLDELAGDDPRIRPIGHVDDRRAFAALLAGSRLYLHGHSVGGINPSAVEALAAGANIAAFDTPFNREAIGDAGSVFGLDGSFDAVVEAALGDEGLPAARERARRRARDWFDLDDITDAYEEILRRAASIRSPRLVTRWAAAR